MGLERREVQDSWLVFKLKNGPAWSAGNQVKVVGVLYGWVKKELQTKLKHGNSNFLLIQGQSQVTEG